MTSEGGWLAGRGAKAKHSSGLLFAERNASIKLKGQQVMLEWSECPVLESVPGKVSGAWVFRGTRVPVSVILKNLKHMTMDQLGENYPSVRREQIESVLDFLAGSAEPNFTGEPVPAIVIHAHPAR